MVGLRSQVPVGLCLPDQESNPTSAGPVSKCPGLPVHGKILQRPSRPTDLKGYLTSSIEFALPEPRAADSPIRST